jgi:pyrimidine-nucleoside phosphorylase
MSQPLGDAVGNALDVAEAVGLLRGETGGRLRELAVAFAARAGQDLLGLGPEEASSRASAAIDSGEALERFRRMVEAQGGDPNVADDPEGVLPRAPVLEVLAADRPGVLARVDAERIGVASTALGAGRVRKGDRIDPAVGIVVRPKIGDRLEAGSPIGEIHARSSEAAGSAASEVLAALHISEGAIDAPPLIHAWLEREEEGAP